MYEQKNIRQVWKEYYAIIIDKITGLGTSVFVPGLLKNCKASREE